MPEPIAAIAGGSIVSGLLGARAAKSAADTQATAAREGLAAQERMFERQLAAQEPFRQSGLEAQNMLMQQLRSFQPYQASAGLSPADIAATQYQATAGLSPADIAATQYQATAGLTPGELASQQFNFQADPGYAFRLAEGIKALEQSAAARGNLLSGTTGKALQRYGQGLASQEYSNAFNRFQTERAARAGLGQMEYGRFADEQARRQALGQTEYGRFADEQARRQSLGAAEYGQFAGERSARMLPLMQAAASGQGLTSGIAGQMAGLGAAQAGAAGQIGAAQAAGAMGMANALAGGVGQAGNLYMQQQMLNALQRPRPVYQPMSYDYASQYGQGTL